MPKLTTELRALHEVVRVTGLGQRRFGPEAYWNALGPILDGSATLACERVGESAEGRPLRMVSFGEGEVGVLAWSQMHGDESTASMALADIFSFLARHPEHALVRALSRRLRLRFVPMLNPDGAARFQRHNAAGVDVNRDARRLATPEGRALKSVHDRIRPAFGFNLHDQSPRFRVGDSDRMAAIALLAPAHNAEREGQRAPARGDAGVRGGASRGGAAGGRARHPLRRRLQPEGLRRPHGGLGREHDPDRIRRMAR